MQSEYGTTAVAISFSTMANAKTSAARLDGRFCSTSGAMYSNVPASSCLWKPPDGLPRGVHRMLPLASTLVLSSSSVSEMPRSVSLSRGCDSRQCVDQRCAGPSRCRRPGRVSWAASLAAESRTLTLTNGEWRPAGDGK